MSRAVREHIITHACHGPLEKAIELSVEAKQRAHAHGFEVAFFPIDFTRADLTWATNLIEHVARHGHMDTLALVDTFGVCTPHAMPYLVRQVCSRFNVRLEAHQAVADRGQVSFRALCQAGAANRPA